MRCSVSPRYLGRVPFEDALARQAVAARGAAEVGAGEVLGFECESTITLGLRGTVEDLSRPDLPFVRVDRGGRATLHNPGQLVIFPVTTTFGRGSRDWVLHLVEVTRAFASGLDHHLSWREDEPGLYAARGGKVVSLGLRLTRGVSTHGLAINVRNDLGEFSKIRTCGVRDAPLDHLTTTLGLEDLFTRWFECFRLSVT